MGKREHSSSSPFRLLGTIAKGLLSVAVLGAAGVAATNAVISARTPRLSPRLGGQFNRYPARFGDIGYTVAGTGSPVLLLHGLEAGRSMAEFRALFDELADQHTVYAFDWLGWGLSDPARDGYSVADFAEQVEEFIRDVIGGETAVVAAGGAGVFAITAASQGAPITKLALICPVPPAYDAPSGQSRAEALIQDRVTGGILNFPILGTAAVNWLRSEKQLGHWARAHGFFDKDKAAAEVRPLHVAAHQDASGWGQRAYVINAFQADWRSAWSELEIPTLLIWGRNAGRDGFDAAPEWLALQPRARLEVVDNALLLPHLEQAEQVVGILRPWLESSS